MFRYFQGRRHHLLEGHGAIEAEGREPGIGGGRGDSAEHAAGQFSTVLAIEVVYAGRLGPTAQATDGHRIAAGGVVDYDGCHSAEAGPLGERDVDGNACRDSGIGGVAALLQDAETGGGGQIVSAGHHVLYAGHQWTIGPDSNGHGTPPACLACDCRV